MNTNIDTSQQAYTSMMKFTTDGRPFVKDIHDLFSALIVQIPFGTHRYLFRSYCNTFTSEDVITALGSLRFTHSTRIPDPDDPDGQRQIRTTTTTTFNMVRDMAKALCQHFLWSRLLESAVDPMNRSFRDRAIWQVTPKGLCILQDFCLRTEVTAMHMLRPFFVNVEPIQLVRIERTVEDDRIITARSKLAAIFRRMMLSLPLNSEQLDTHRSNSSLLPGKHIVRTRKSSRPTSTISTVSISSASLATDSASSSSDSSASSVTSSTSSSPSPTSLTAAPFTMQNGANDGRIQLLDSRLLLPTPPNPSSLAPIKKAVNRTRSLFSSQLCCDWLVEYCTIASRDEAEELATEFLRNRWLGFEDASKISTYGNQVQASKSVWLSLTAAGKDILLQQAEEIKADSYLSERRHSRPTSMIGCHRSNNHHTETNSANSTAVPSIITTAATTTSASATSNTLEPLLDGNSTKLKTILDDAQLRSLFKDFLAANFCTENLDFWIDYATLRRKCRNQSPAMPSHHQRELLEDAYAIWTQYLAPGGARELNVDHALRQEMARHVASIVTTLPSQQAGFSLRRNQNGVVSTHSNSQSLRMMIKWFDKVEEHILRLMAMDSVPKFIKTPAYRDHIASNQDEKLELAPIDKANSNPEVDTEPVVVVVA